MFGVCACVNYTITQKRWTSTHAHTDRHLDHHRAPFSPSFSLLIYTYTNTNTNNFAVYSESSLCAFCITCSILLLIFWVKFDFFHVYYTHTYLLVSSKKCCMASCRANRFFFKFSLLTTIGPKVEIDKMWLNSIDFVFNLVWITCLHTNVWIYSINLTITVTTQ